MLYKYEKCWVVYHSKDWEIKVAMGWVTHIVEEHITESGERMLIAEMLWSANGCY
jgi:hypothetical protein